jgi:hypothetical protein
MCTGDETGLTGDVPKTVVDSCTAGTKCEYTCNSGYASSGGSCVAIPSLPTVSLSASPTTIDLGNSTTLTWTVNGATSCSASGDWSGAKSSSNGIHNQAVTPISTGTKTYTLTCINAGGSTSDSATVTVNTPLVPNQAPTATITAPSSNVTIEAGESVSFSGTGSDPDGSITNYRWNSGSCSGTQLSSSSSFSRTFSTAGTYRIYFSVRDDDGAWSTNCPYRTITVDEPCTDTCSSLGYSCGTHTICGVSTNCGSCYGDRCRNITYTCSSSNVYQERGDYQKRVCSGASCVYTYQSWLDYICDGVDQPCGTATCKNECTFEYCASLTEVKRKTEGIEETCTSGPTGGCGTKPNDNCNGITDVETCEEGEVCAEIAGTQCNGHSKVDCVPKATTWTEE